MRIIKKLKRTTKQYIMVALICIFVIGSAAISTSIITISHIRDEYNYMIKETNQEINDNTKTVYITLEDIKAGDYLTLDKVEEKKVFSSQPVDSYISKEELGRATMIDIPKGTHIIKGMLAKNLVSSDMREIEYEVIHISPNIVSNDYVDVRIVYPNGENYIVMSKKSLKGLQDDTPICYMWVDEEEILRMSAAIVDAALYLGSRIYVTKYIEPNIQDASTITYVPNISVLSLIENDPNIVNRCSQLLNKEVRRAMENRLANSIGMDVSTIRWEIDNEEIGYMPIDNIAYKHIETKVEETKSNIESKANEEHEKANEEHERAKEELEIANEELEIKLDENEASRYFPELGKADRLDGKNSVFATEG